MNASAERRVSLAIANKRRTCMICPHCQSQVADGVKFCGSCGKPLMGATPAPQPAGYPPQPQSQYSAQPQSQYNAQPQSQYNAQPQPNIYVPPNQYEEYTSNEAFGAAVPRAELHNPKGPLRVADMTITIDGELVPVVDIMLGNQMPIYFEHHILLWKHPGVQLGFKSLKGAARRF